MGYSKLGKAALISKLAGLAPNSLPPSPGHNTPPEANVSFLTSGPPPLDNPAALAGAGPGTMGPPSPNFPRTEYSFWHAYGSKFRHVGCISATTSWPFWGPRENAFSICIFKQRAHLKA